MSSHPTMGASSTLTPLTHTCDDNVIYLWCTPAPARRSHHPVQSPLLPPRYAPSCPVLPRPLVAEGPYE